VRISDPADAAAATGYPDAASGEDIKPANHHPDIPARGTGCVNCRPDSIFNTGNHHLNVILLLHLRICFRVNFINCNCDVIC